MTHSSGQPLYTERQGKALALTHSGFRTLISQLLRALHTNGLLQERLGWVGERSFSWPAIDKDAADAFFVMSVGDAWPTIALQDRMMLSLQSDENIFDLIELLHRDVVSLAVSGGYDREAGRAAFRERVNPALARRDPPLELVAGGQIVQRLDEPFRRLVEQELPDDAPRKEVGDRVDDAIRHFRRREATAGDRRAAVRELADVLEYLRPEVKEHLLAEDERSLFRLANEYAIRHNKRETRRDFDEPTWLAWAFYVYLATIKLVLHLRDREVPPGGDASRLAAAEDGSASG